MITPGLKKRSRSTDTNILCIKNAGPTETTAIHSLNCKFIVHFTSMNYICNTHQTEFTLTCLHASSETEVKLFYIMNVQYAEEKDVTLTKCNTTCELIDGGLGHAVRQHTGELQRDDNCEAQFLWRRVAENVLARWSLIPTDLCPLTLDTLTMEPLVLIRWGTQSWVRWYTDLENEHSHGTLPLLNAQHQHVSMTSSYQVRPYLTLMFMTLSYWAKSVASMLPMARTPALLTRTSSRPKWAIVCSTVFFTVSSSVRSPGTSKG